METNDLLFNICTFINYWIGMNILTWMMNKYNNIIDKEIVKIIYRTIEIIIKYTQREKTRFC